MQRRDFIKSSCRACLLGAAGISIAMEACSPKTATGEKAKRIVAENNTATVPLSQLSTAQAFTVIGIEKYPFEIAIEKKSEGQYRTLLLMCTHQDNPLTPTGAGYTCAVHGSRFSKKGEVLNGPAAEALHELKTTLVNTDLIIQLEKI